MDRREDTTRWGEASSLQRGEGIDVYGIFNKFYSDYPGSDIRLLQKVLE